MHERVIQPQGYDRISEVGRRDGMQLLAHIEAPYAPLGLKELAEVEMLRRLWEQHYETGNREIRTLDLNYMPEASRRIEFPARWRLATQPSVRRGGLATRCISRRVATKGYHI